MTVNIGVKSQHYVDTQNNRCLQVRILSRQAYNSNQLIEAPQCQQKHFQSNALAELVIAHLCVLQNSGASERAKLH